MIAAGVEGGSRRQIRREWSLSDYFKMVDHWQRIAPPAYISLALIARANGAQFGGGSGPAPAVARVEQATPDSAASIVAQLGGGGEVRAYKPPNLGLPI